MGPRLGCDPQGCGTTPQCEGLGHQRGGVASLAILRQPSRVPAQGTKAQQVEGVGLHLQAVAARATYEPTGFSSGPQIWFEQAAQRPDMALHYIDRAVGRILSPQDIHDVLHRHRVPCLYQEQCQQAALLRRPKFQFHAAAPGPKRAQNRETRMHKDSRADNCTMCDCLPGAPAVRQNGPASRTVDAGQGSWRGGRPHDAAIRGRSLCRRTA